MSRSSRRLRGSVAALLGVVLTLLLQITHAKDRDDPWALFDSPWFDKLDLSHGIPHSITTALAQDDRGLIWIGTMGGLVRYDGHRMQVFDAGTRSQPALPDIYVRTLLPLPDGNLLIGTNAGGLTRFDPRDNRFHNLPSRSGTGDRKVYDLASDGADGVWVVTDAGLDHLNLASGEVTQQKIAPDAEPRSFSVLQDRAGNLWLGNNKGLFVRHHDAAEFERVKASGAAEPSLRRQIWALYEDSQGRIWAGSGRNGAVYRDVQGKWHALPPPTGEFSGARMSTVRDFLEVAPDRIWIALDGGGVLEYSPETKRLRSLQNDPALRSSLPGNAVRSLLKDASGNLWAATDLGVAYNNPAARMAFSILPSPLQNNALSDNNVHTIFVDSRGRIWLGLGGGHLDLFDLAKGDIRHLRLTGNQMHRDVQAITEDQGGSIWVGSQGLSRINPDTLEVQNHTPPELEGKPVLSLTSDGTALLAGTYDGIFRYEPQTGVVAHYNHVNSDPSSLASDVVRHIGRFGNRWWFGTNQGISIGPTPLHQSGFTNLTHHLDDPDSLPQDYIGGMTADALGRIWVSTYGGLAVLAAHEPDTSYRFKTLDMTSGLASEKVNAVLADDLGHIWASLSNSIAMVDGNTLEVRNLGARDGLHILSYIHTAAAHAPGGELLFGGLGGLTVIRPHWRTAEAAPATLAITLATINGEPVPFAALPRQGDRITVGSRNRHMRLDFSLLDYRAPAETTYSYRIAGLDEDWNLIPRGTPPSAVYTNLPPGEYPLELRATTRGMQPQMVEVTFDLLIQPRWYETIAARVTGMLLLLAVIAALVHLRTLFLQLQAIRLQQKIDDQTHTLKLANQRLDALAGTDGLTGAYNRRRLLELAAIEHERADETHPACIAVFDLDHFKLVNDNFGHQAGDAVIRSTIDIVRRLSRQGDLLGRYGGEEFVLCLPQTRLVNAMDTVERIRHAVASTPVEHEGRSISITTSIGVAMLNPAESLEQWLARADSALYAAKRGGRNRSVAAE